MPANKWTFRSSTFLPKTFYLDTLAGDQLSSLTSIITTLSIFNIDWLKILETEKNINVDYTTRISGQKCFNVEFTQNIGGISRLFNVDNLTIVSPQHIFNLENTQKVSGGKVSNIDWAIKLTGNNQINVEWLSKLLLDRIKDVDWTQKILPLNIFNKIIDVEWQNKLAAIFNILNIDYNSFLRQNYSKDIDFGQGITSGKIVDLDFVSKVSNLNSFAVNWRGQIVYLLIPQILNIDYNSSLQQSVILDINCLQVLNILEKFNIDFQRIQNISFNKVLNVDWWLRPETASGIWILGSRGTIWILDTRSTDWVLSQR